ncbi:hypothetical protein [Paraburkholderia haematera]|uniref:Uncharacterized protein n=1 Tax=Paraburkholderia haematera TaxID=2793077 RepID=A0ABN7M2D2_9BURK|nr:hypothetical protein [Paraburkholderia haematera]CAE6781702.1 hypothetical protein R69888_04332 [Paraburkholderia haematera]
MTEFLHADRQQDCTPFDAAVIRMDQLRSLAGLLSLEEVSEQFSELSTLAQILIFALFKDGLADIRAAPTQTAV